MTPEELQELCALYVLGALEPPEAAALEARLQAGDPAVVREVEAFREVVALLPHALLPVPPDPAVRVRLMARAQSTLTERPSRQATALPGLLRRLRAPLVWFPTAIAAGLVLVSGWLISDLRQQVASRAALVAGLSQQVAGLEAQVQQLRSVAGDHERLLALLDLRQQVTGLEAQVRQLQNVAGDHERLLALLTLPGVKIAALAGTKEAREAGARLLWDTKRREWTVISRDLPPPPPGKAYQLWVLTPKGPSPSGTFRTDTQGMGTIHVELPLDRASIVGAAVSLEPEGGMPQPTGEIVLLGKF
jgi:anti-sigma-K factor RskA